MIEVEQRKLWRPDDHPDGPSDGDCFRACIASILELEYESVPELPRGSHQALCKWLSVAAPGVSVLQRLVCDSWKGEETFESWREWPEEHHEDGFWIATVRSPRIPTCERFGCGCADRVPGGDPECKWCHGEPGKRSMGIAWGLHAVVMRYGTLAWDPHPERDGTIGPFRSATTFRLTDPAPAVHALLAGRS
jgi:hypothetical protein